MKTSIVLFYRRIFCTGQRTWFSMLTAAFIGLTVMWTLAFFFAILFECGTDIQAGWGTYDEFKAHCDNTVILDEVYSIIDFVLDLIVFIMPLPMVFIGSDLFVLADSEAIDLAPANVNAAAYRSVTGIRSWRAVWHLFSDFL